MESVVNTIMGTMGKLDTGSIIGAVDLGSMLGQMLKAASTMMKPELIGNTL